jgi:hypothetical protein
MRTSFVALALTETPRGTLLQRQVPTSEAEAKYGEVES